MVRYPANEVDSDVSRNSKLADDHDGMLQLDTNDFAEIRAAV